MTLTLTKFFPLGVAKGASFCNRVNERKKIIQNIHAGRHMMLMSPRRYGKTSLIFFVLEETKLPYAEIDLFVAINSKMVEDQILQGVKELINKVSSKTEQVVSIIKEYIKNLQSRWVVGMNGIGIELIPDKSNDTITNIIETLQLLENILKKKRIKACFFIDEFQEIGKLDESQGLEGAIRHVAQNTEYLTFIFSGSNRHILANMFHDRSRPLYKLCDTFEIERIQESHYIPFFKKMSLLQWNISLSENIIKEILNQTELHPYYINAFCSILWMDTNPPEQSKIAEKWHEYVVQEKSKTAKELANLNISQKKILISIAKGNVTDISGKISLQKLNLSSATVNKSLKLLQNNDYIGKNENGNYYIIDPLIKSSLNVFYPED